MNNLGIYQYTFNFKIYLCCKAVRCSLVSFYTLQSGTETREKTRIPLPLGSVKPELYLSYHAIDGPRLPADVTLMPGFARTKLGKMLGY